MLVNPDKSKSQGMLLRRGISSVKKRPIAIFIAVLCLLCVTGAAIYLLTGGDDTELSLPTTKVVRGPLLISIIESGEIESERSKTISNELRWSTIILDVVPEGTLVEKGQTIIKFECKELMDEIERSELEVTSADTSHTQAKGNLELRKKEMDNKVLKSQRALDETKENQKRYLDHESEIQTLDMANSVKYAEEDLELAKKDIAFKKKMNADERLNKPYSTRDIEAGDQKVERLKNALEKAKLSKEKFEKFDHPRKLQELKEGAADAELALKRTDFEAERQISNAKADMMGKKLNLDRRKKKLAELHEDKKTKLNIVAEEVGLVVYRSGSGRRATETVVEKGEKINPRQRLMIIPDMSTLQIKTRVYEAMVKKTSVGLKTIIRLDSNPDKVLYGKIHKVAVLPDSQHRWINPDLKIFTVIVKFDELPKDLKPGMTCKVEMVLAELENVLSVPIAAVFTEGEKTLCYRIEDGDFEPVEVKVGGMNDEYVQILSGLKEGDEVTLTKPGHKSEKKAPGDPVPDQKGDDA